MHLEMYRELQKKLVPYNFLYLKLIQPKEYASYMKSWFLITIFRISKKILYLIQSEILFFF